MKVINFEEWKKNSITDEHHLKLKKRFKDLNDLEVKLLLEKVVDRLNFSIDQIYRSFELHKEAFEILDGVVKKQNSLVENTKSLNNLAKKHTDILYDQAKILGVIKE